MASVGHQGIEIDSIARRGHLGSNSGLSLHLGLRTLDQRLNILSQIGAGIGLMAQHLIDELTEVAGMGLRRLVDGIEIEAIDRGLGQHGANTTEGD
ncbi:hypothetical protein ACFS32_03515 [Novosphingobium pokkalii]|uniref:hypothetical protein n=1 Tax=Novosphingobium pokkalii TaxID=1770194 RepID=UPI00363487CF